MGFGLALAGGGTRGAAHVGVLLAFEEENLIPDYIAGTSAGSIAAGLYASGMNAFQMREVVIYLSKKGLCYLDPDYLGVLKFIPQMILHKRISLSGLLKGDRLRNYLLELTQGKTVSDVQMKIVIPAVDIVSGLTIAYTNVHLMRNLEAVKWESDILLCDAMMASSSVPAVFVPRRIGGYYLVDGGVTNILPVNLLAGAGENNVIAVDIGENYETPQNNSVFEIVSHSMSIMQENLKICTASREKLLLKPQLPEGAGLLTFDQMVPCMEAGYVYTKGLMPQIKRCLRQDMKVRSLG